MDGDQPQPDDQSWAMDSTTLGDVLEPSDLPAEDLADLSDPSDPPAEDLTDLSDLPEPPQTGDEAVDQATGNVARAMHEPLEAQLAAYELAHRTLQDRLADVES